MAYTCSTCYKSQKSSSKLHWIDDKQVCDKCYFKFIKYDKLGSKISDNERKAILYELLNQEEEDGNVL